VARSRARRVTRVLASGLVFHVKTLSQSNFFILVSVIQPVIFASISFYMFRAGGRAPTLLYAALGAGLMGIWSSTLFGSGGAIQWQRWQGTLELIVVVPPPLLQVLLPLTVATSAIGLYSVVATLIWGMAFFGMPLQLVHPFMFGVALVATVVGLGLLGLVLASTFVLYRAANALSNLLEYPVWLITGVLVPVSLLPGWTHVLGWILAPTWGIRALRAAALGGDALPGIAMCALLSCIYLVAGGLCLRHFEKLARERGTLALA
jgi:ABC-2 type transport system permease protein